ncbi:MAG: hypothetical protein ACYS8L_10145 [Planctomycetota bacterium]
MSLVGGYFSDNGKLATEALRRRVAEYRIVQADSPRGYEDEVVETRSGHVISKCKKGYRHRMRTLADRDGNVLMASGYLFPPLKDGANRQDRLLDLCVKSRGRIIEESEGEYVSLFVDGRSGEVHVINDRFGARPFFILRARGRTYFASNLAFACFLASGHREPDALGLLQLFSCRRTLGPRTHMRDVVRLLPASHMTISSNGTRTARYWSPTYDVDGDLDPVAYAEEVFDAYRRGTEQRAARLGEGVVSLSGGCDSRLLAGSLPEDSGFSAFTFVDSLQDDETPEVRAAAQVSQILGLDHCVRRVPEGEISRLAMDLVSLAGGLVGMHHSVKTMQSVAAAQGTTGSVMTAAPAGAVAGGVIKSPVLLDPARSQQSTRLMCRSCKLDAHNAEPALRLLFRDDVLEEHYPKLDEVLLESLGAVGGPTPAHRLVAWALTYGEMGFTFACPISSHPDVAKAHPHLGYDYCDLMLRLPAHWLYRKSFYRFMIYQCLPQLRGVIYANTGKPLSGRLKDIPRWAPELLPGYDVVLKVKSLARRHLRPRPASASLWRPFFYYLLKQDNRLLAVVTDILHSRPSLGRILDVDRCDRFVDATDSWTTSALAAFTSADRRTTPS